MLARILEGAPADEISPLTNTLVSITSRGLTRSLYTPHFSDCPYRFRDLALHFLPRHRTVRGLHQFDRLPRIYVSEDSPNDYCLRNNSADGSPVLESLLRDLLVNSGRHSDVNLAIESSRHVPLYHGIHYVTLTSE